MNKWTKLSKEEDDCIGIVVYDKNLEPLTIVQTLNDENKNKAFICSDNKELYLMTKRGDTPNWDISPLPEELADLVSGNIIYKY